MTLLKIPQHSVSDIDFLNTLLGHARKAVFPIGQHRGALVLSAPDSPQRPIWGADFRVADERLFVGFSQQLALADFAAELAGVELEQLPKEIQLTILQMIFADALQGLQKIANVDIGLDNVLWRDEIGIEEDPVLCLTLYLEDSQIIDGIVYGQTALTWISQWGKHMPLTQVRDFGGIPYRLYVELGHTLLPAADYGSLAVQDVVLLDNDGMYREQHCQGFFPQAGKRLELTFDKNHFTVDRVMIDEEEQMVDEAEEQTAGVTDQLPIKLVFEVGSTQIPLRDLQTLQAGYTFSLDTPVDKAVTIRANGKVVGVGELLQVEERIGVRVIEFVDNGCDRI